MVVGHVADHQDHASGHERHTLLDYARRLAELRGDAFGGLYQPASRPAGPLYFVPASTLTCDEAQALGIAGPDDLFGGVVPAAFVATKAISHPLVSPDACAPPGWQPDLARQVQGAVLAGCAAFALDDARRGGLRLLQQGPVRLKPVRASGGRGQAVAHEPHELESWLRQLDPAELAHGLVLEEQLEEVRTFSVGQVQVGDLVASYFGVQRLTPDNQGHEVFGGSALTVVRGGFDELLALRPEPDLQRAVEQARRYDAAVQASFRGFFASRRNYDVALGRSLSGSWRSGVLEQSWRVGGATGPELAALEVLRAEPGRHVVRVEGFEIFGDSPPPPADARVHYRGHDPEVGPLTKYTVVLPE